MSALFRERKGPPDVCQAAHTLPPPLKIWQLFQVMRSVNLSQTALGNMNADFGGSW